MPRQREDGVGVADDKTLKTHLLAKHLAQHVRVAARGHVVQRHVGRHHRAAACVDGRLKGRQVNILQLDFGQVATVVVAPAVGRTVTGKMFHAAQDAAGRTERGPLETQHLRTGHRTSEVRILAGAFDHAPPAGVAGDVHHRRKGPVDARGERLRRRDLRGAPEQLRVPRRGHRQRHGEGRFVAVDDIEAEEDRDAEARLFDGHLLVFVDEVRIDRPEDGADQALADQRLRLVARAERVGADLRELADLLGKRHARQERVGPLFEGLRARLGGLGDGGRGGRRKGKRPEAGERGAGEGDE